MNYYRDTSLIRAYIVDGEIVDWLQRKVLKQRANGFISTLYIADAGIINETFQNLMRIQHSIDSVIRGMEYRGRIRE